MTDVEHITAKYLAGAIDATQFEIELDLTMRPHTLVRSVRDGIYPRSDVVDALVGRYGYEMVMAGMSSANEITIYGEVL